MIYQSGFTLIELLMVLVITAILLSLGSSGYQHVSERAKVNELSKLLEADLDYTKQHAGLSLGSHLLCSRQNCSSNDWTSGWSLISQGEVIRSYRNDSQITIAKNLDSKVSFDLFGRLTQGLGTSFYICGSHYGQRLILNRAGRIRIEDYPCP